MTAQERMELEGYADYGHYASIRGGNKQWAAHLKAIAAVYRAFGLKARVEMRDGGTAGTVWVKGTPEQMEQLEAFHATPWVSTINKAILAATSK